MNALVEPSAAPAVAPPKRPLPPLAAPGRSSPLTTIGQSFLSALEALLGNKLRALLTMLGIIIGVAAVIFIEALGQGATGMVTRQLSQLGTNLITVQPASSTVGGVSSGAGSKPSLTDADVTTIGAQVPGVMAISPVVSAQAQVVFQGQNWSTRIQGVAPAYGTIQNDTVSSGAFFTDQDELDTAAVAVLGQTVVDKLFPSGANPVGAQIRIRNVIFRVGGVLATKGNNGFQNQDDVVLIPYRTAERRLLGSTRPASISIQADNSADMNAMAAGVTQALRESHHLPPSAADDFTVSNLQQELSIATQIIGYLSLFLSVVAGVSLLVGGIGIMNIMLVSVTERTREIGIRMAIGARAKDVLLQFLAEAVTLALAGGLIGIVLAWLATLPLAAVTGWPIAVPLGAVGLAIGFSVLVGVFFGFYPARRAARLDPIVALRHE